MKPLILFTAMTVIGIIGVIGTIDESHAQTPLTIPEPDNYPDIDEDSNAISIQNGIPYWYISENNEVITDTTKSGTLFNPSEIEILENPLLPKRLNDEEADRSCGGSLDNINDLLRPALLSHIGNLTIPDNITPNSARNDLNAIGINWDPPTADDDNESCGVELDRFGKRPLITTKELRFTLYNQADKKAYYLTQNMSKAQPIPLCATENFNTNNQTLKGDTKMCYGKHESSMVIISKKLSGFYGAAETITTPAKPIALDSDIVETQESYDEKLRLKALKEQQEREYLALLKKLYLPAV